MVKNCQISFLVLSIKSTISCLTFFELPLVRLCSPNNAAFKSSTICVEDVAYVLYLLTS